MKNVKPSSEELLPVATLEQENQLIAEAKRVLYERMQHREGVFDSPKVVRDYLQLLLSEQQREIFYCLFVDSQHRLIVDRALFEGTVDTCSIYPREVVKAALQVNAAGVIFAHNHPSGVAEPSQSDQRITDRLNKALSLVDIRVLDHFVIGDSDIVSFAERGLL